MRLRVLSGKTHACVIDTTAWSARPAQEWESARQRALNRDSKLCEFQTKRGLSMRFARRARDRSPMAQIFLRNECGRC